MPTETGENTAEGNETTEDSIIKEQSQTIKTLSSQLTKTGEGKTEIIYAPPEKADGSPNYFLLIAIVAGFFFFMRR